MNKIGIIVLCIAFAIGARAQDNDTALLRSLNVAEVQKKLFVHAFVNNKDSCLYTHRKFNKKGQLVYEKTDMECMGWNSYEEMFLNYDGTKVNKIDIHRDGLPFNTSFYAYTKDAKGASTIKTLFHQTNDSMLVTNTYFLSKKDKLDSTFTKTINQDGGEELKKTIARYDKKGNLVQLFVVNEYEIPTEMVAYEVDEEGVVNSVAFTTYGQKPDFTQVFYRYDQNGRVASSYNTINQKSEYFYLDNGLINNILNYNPKGELEAEYIFDYTYYK